MSDAAASTPKPEGDDKSDASTITIRVRDQDVSSINCCLSGALSLLLIRSAERDS
ncbi:unnamed protein product [Ectocarpus sp. 8 AP-2014]